MSIKWAAKAREDLAAIDDYYRSLDEEFACLVAGEAVRAARFLLENHFAGAPLDTNDRRKWPVRGTPYALLYRPVREGVLILRVQHSRQSWRLQ